MGDYNTFLGIFNAAGILVLLYLFSTQRRSPVETHHLERHLHLLINKLDNFMATAKEELQAIKAELVASNEKVDKVGADVQRLHDIISGAGELPTPEEWTEVKNIASALTSKLTGIDEQTPE